MALWWSGVLRISFVLLLDIVMSAAPRGQVLSGPPPTRHPRRPGSSCYRRAPTCRGPAQAAAAAAAKAKAEAEAGAAKARMEFGAIRSRTVRLEVSGPRQPLPLPLGCAQRPMACTWRVAEPQGPHLLLACLGWPLQADLAAARSAAEAQLAELQGAVAAGQAEAAQLRSARDGAQVGGRGQQPQGGGGVGGGGRVGDKGMAALLVGGEKGDKALQARRPRKRLEPAAPRCAGGARRRCQGGLCGRQQGPGQGVRSVE